jgi:hypothetical protein
MGRRTTTLTVRRARRPEPLRSPDPAGCPLGRRPGLGIGQQRVSMGIYGRTVAEVISDINLVLVEDGQAFAYRRDLGSCDAREYRDAEYRASLCPMRCGS